MGNSHNNALVFLGDMVQFVNKSEAEILSDPYATPAMLISVQVMKSCLENAYVMADAMLNPCPAFGAAGEEVPQAISFPLLSLEQIGTIRNQMIRANAQFVMLADDGYSFQAIGILNQYGDARQLYTSESLQSPL